MSFASSKVVRFASKRSGGGQTLVANQTTSSDADSVDQIRGDSRGGVRFQVVASELSDDEQLSSTSGDNLFSSKSHYKQNDYKWPLQTTFTTIGPATEGTRQRIRHRQNRIAEEIGSSVGSIPSPGGRQSPHHAVSSTKRTINAAEIQEIRDISWMPLIYNQQSVMTASGTTLTADLTFSIPHHYAWEIGRRGSVAFQSTKWTVFGSWFPQVATRFLILDGTDPISFLTVYKTRRRAWSRIQVFTAYDMFRAQWDPAGGSFRVTMANTKSHHGHGVKVEEYHDVGRAFIVAAIACLRELAVWIQISKRVDMSGQNPSGGHQALPARRHSTILAGNEASGQTKRVMSKFIQPPMIRISDPSEIPALMSIDSAKELEESPAEPPTEPARPRRRGWELFFPRTRHQ